MEGLKMNRISLILFIAFAAFIPTLKAQIDDVWERRAQESWNRTLESYEPDPVKIVTHLNTNVHRWVHFCFLFIR